MASIDEKRPLANQFLDRLHADPPNPFRDEIEALLTQDESTERDAKLDAALKSNGFEDLTWAQLQRLLNPPTREDQPGEDPPPAGERAVFDFKTWSGKYTITSADYPNYTMWVARDGTIAFGEKPTSQPIYKATATEGKDGKWSVNWDAKELGTFKIQFQVSILVKDTESVANFIGHWNKKDGDKSKEVEFKGKLVPFTPEDDSEATASDMEHWAMGIGGLLLLLAGGILIYKKRKAGLLEKELEKDHQEKIKKEEKLNHDRRVDMVSAKFFETMPKDIIRQFEKDVSVKYRDLLNARYANDPTGTLRQTEHGKPPPEAVEFHQEVRDMLHESVDVLVKSSSTDIKNHIDHYNEWEKKGSTYTDALEKAVKENALEKATRGMNPANGEYKGPAALLLKWAGETGQLQHTALEADINWQKSTTTLTDYANQQHDFKKLVDLHQSLYEKTRNNDALHLRDQALGLYKAEYDRMKGLMGDAGMAEVISHMLSEINTYDKRVDARREYEQKEKEAPDHHVTEKGMRDLMRLKHR